MYRRVPEDANNRLILSGRLSSGKDYVVNQAGYTVYGIADPIYKLTEEDLGTSDKSADGVRRHMQKIGAWGRGESSEDYPFTEKRADYAIRMWKKGHEITGMGTHDIWQHFGKSDFWTRLLHSRIVQAPEEKIAITNGRFPEEINFFTSHQFQHYHVMCSEDVRRERLEAEGEVYDPDTQQDVTEQLARELDCLSVGQALSEEAMVYDLSPNICQDVKEGTSVIWNDPSPVPNYELQFPLESQL